MTFLYMVWDPDFPHLMVLPSPRYLQMPRVQPANGIRVGGFYGISLAVTHTHTHTHTQLLLKFLGLEPCLTTALNCKAD